MVRLSTQTRGHVLGLEYQVERYSSGIPVEVEEFWYSIYVAEMGLDLASADHRSQRLVDPLAESGHVLVARSDNGTILGTMLALYGQESSLGYYPELYRPPEDLSRIGVSAKMLISQDARRTRLVIDLATLAYRWAVHLGVEVDYCDCQRRTVPLFRRLGYRKVPGKLDHPIYGESLLMRLDCLDRAHLEASGSPFAKWCPDDRFPAREIPDTPAGRFGRVPVEL